MGVGGFFFQKPNPGMFLREHKSTLLIEVTFSCQIPISPSKHTGNDFTETYLFNTDQVVVSPTFIPSNG